MLGDYFQCWGGGGGGGGGGLLQIKVAGDRENIFHFELNVSNIY